MAKKLGAKEQVLVNFPTFDPNWPEDVKIGWFEAYIRLINMQKTGKKEGERCVNL